MAATASVPRFFTAKDAVAGALDGERVAVIGYGHLGRPFALNLRDGARGLRSLVVGNRGDEYAEQARADGLTAAPIAEAVAGADVALLLLPDEVLPEVFAGEVGPNLRPGAAIVLASGYTLAYGLIAPPAGVDVLLLAPRMAGENARQRFLAKQGFMAYVAVEQEGTSGRAWPRLLGLAEAVGVLQAGAMELDARREAALDLFIEQTMGAVLGMAVMSAFAVGREAGIPPEAMVLEMYMSQEMEMVFRAFREEGFYRASSVHGPTALYGGFVRTMELLGLDLGGRFHDTLVDITSGGFARRFQAEREAGYPLLQQAEAMSHGDNDMVQAEQRVRALLGR